MGNAKIGSHNSIDDPVYEPLDLEKEMKKKFHMFQDLKFVKTLNSYKKIKQAFADYDLDKDGYIQGEEYDKFIKDVAEKSEIEISSIQGIFEKFDLNNDGKISQQEFVSVLTRKCPKKVLLLGTGILWKVFNF